MHGRDGGEAVTQLGWGYTLPQMHGLSTIYKASGHEESVPNATIWGIVSSHQPAAIPAGMLSLAPGKPHQQKSPT